VPCKSCDGSATAGKIEKDRRICSYTRERQQRCRSGANRQVQYPTARINRAKEFRSFGQKTFGFSTATAFHFFKPRGIANPLARVRFVLEPEAARSFS